MGKVASWAVYTFKLLKLLVLFSPYFYLLTSSTGEELFDRLTIQEKSPVIRDLSMPVVWC